MECSIASLNNRRHTHLLLLMYKLIKKRGKYVEKPVRQSRLHMAPVFWHYKPNNEKARKNVIYRGAIEWNSLLADTRNIWC